MAGDPQALIKQYVKEKDRERTKTLLNTIHTDIKLFNTITDRANFTEDEYAFVVSILLELAGWDPVTLGTTDDNAPPILERTGARQDSALNIEER